jgi:hypothetical protein
MTARDIIVNKDIDNDVLYVSKSGMEAIHTININATADILLKLDPNKRSLVGLIIEDFSTIFPQLAKLNDWELMEYFDETIELMNVSCSAMSKA